MQEYTSTSEINASSNSGGRKGARNLKEITVKVYDNDIEKAIRILKKKIQNDGLFKRLKLKKSYEKPSEFRRRKQREALRRERIAAARRAYRR
jgi:small subunit ribosomal protein S21